MSRMQLTDAQRRAAIDKAGVNTVLTSGAGCGKTAVLAHRFTQVLLNRPDADDPLAGLVALTFTDKAALQMRQRLGELLGELADESGGEDLVKLRGWTEQLPEARIMTIHSFCASLLRTHAIAAGVDPSFAVLADELVKGQMIDEAAEQATLAAVESGDRSAAEVVAELRLAQTIDEVAGLVSGRLGLALGDYADAQATLDRWGRRVADEAQAAWRRLADDDALAAELQALIDARCSDPADKLAAWRDEKLTVARGIIADPAARTAESFEAISKGPGNVGKAASWGGKEQVKAVRGRMKAFVERLGEWSIYAEHLNKLDTRAASVLAALTALAARANEHFAAAKRARGLLDFDDLLGCASELLTSDPRLRSGISSQIDQMLIDECQDTNAFQLDMLVGLARDGAGPPPAGKLCLIGDAKQSIYRFRGAEVEAFRRLCEELGPAGRENLDVSFRTHAAGVAFVNKLFSPLMADAYEPIRAHRLRTPAQPSVEIILAAPGDEEPIGSAAQAVELQAAATAQRIAELIDSRQRCVWDAEAEEFRPAEYGDVAILFARMTQSLGYERELAARGIPYYVVAGTGFFRQQEVYDVLNALRVIDDPTDDIALVGLLRSGMFALDDNALMHLAETTGKPYARGFRGDALADRLPPDDLAAMSAAVQMVTRLHRQKDSLGIAGLIEAVLAATGFEAALLSGPHGRRKAGNVRMLIERGRSAWREGMTLAGFVTQMNALTLSESRYEQAAVAGEGDNVVRLMTIHKAKGLEFPVVFVSDLNANKGPRSYRRVLRRTDWGLTCRVTGNEDDDGEADKPLSYKLAGLRERADDEAEAIRQYYVALTRHEDHLVLVGADWRDKDGRLRQPGSFIRRVDEVLGLSRALDGGQGGELPYGEGHAAVCRRMVPTPGKRRRGGAPPGRAMLAKASDAAELVDAIRRSADVDAPAPPLLGALPVEVGRAELAVTALGDFAACPMLYRWRHELRVPAEALPAGLGRPAATCEASCGADSADQMGVDAATAGTFFHRCMELMDFAHPQAAADLARQAAEEMSLPRADAADLADELAEMVRLFRTHELWRQIAQAGRALRELEFLLTVGPAALRGKIDLVVADSTTGEWHVVDYKSDRLAETSPAAVADHSEHHRLQMLTYAMAAGRHLQRPAPQATLYYLRPAVSHTYAFDGAAVADGERELAGLVESLIAARRSGQFEIRRSDLCGLCPYAPLCERFAAN